MEAELASKLAYIITAVALSFIAASFYAFGANIVLDEQRYAAKYFRNFFIIIGFAFITFAMTTVTNNPFLTAISNIAYITSFCCLRMGYASRFGFNKELQQTYRKELVIILVIVVSLNLGVFYYFYPSPSMRVASVILAAIYYSFQCIQHVKSGDKKSGEWASKVSLVNTTLLLIALLVALAVWGRSVFFISVLLIMQSVFVLMFFGSSIVLFLSDTSAKFQRESVTDFLTGLFNRRYFQGRLNEIVHSAQRQLTPASLLIIDIDFFKKVNDTFGHEAGDQVLKIASGIIKDSVRVSDIASRYGGEEFCILLPHTDAKGAMIFAERIRQSIELATLRWKSDDIRITASFGVHEIDVDESPETAMEKADAALYHAKEAGRNQVTQFQPSLLANSHQSA